jgi:hypothetical protein
MTLGIVVHSGPGTDSEADVELELGLVFPKFVELTLTDDDELPFDVEINLVFEKAAGRYVAESVRTARRNGVGEITTGGLRAVRVQELIQLGTDSLTEVVLANVDPSIQVLSDDHLAEIKAAGPGNRESLIWVARIYLVAMALNSPPAKAVAEKLQLSTPTASVWIRRARDRGILTEPARSSADAGE